MSAFVIDPKTMHRVVRLIVKGGLTRSWMGLSVDPDHADARDNPTAIGRVLYALNVEAVKQRYPDCRDAPENMPGLIEGTDPEHDYEFDQRPVAFDQAARIDAHKALACLIYQCSEGDVTETAGFQELCKFSGMNAERIVRGLPEYNRAPWDEPLAPIMGDAA